MRCRVILEKKFFFSLSQEAEVGVSERCSAEGAPADQHGIYRFVIEFERCCHTDPDKMLVHVGIYDSVVVQTIDRGHSIDHTASYLLFRWFGGLASRTPCRTQHLQQNCDRLLEGEVVGCRF